MSDSNNPELKLVVTADIADAQSKLNSMRDSTVRATNDMADALNKTTNSTNNFGDGIKRNLNSTFHGPFVYATAAIKDTGAALDETSKQATLNSNQIMTVTHSVRSFAEMMIAGANPIKAFSMEFIKLSAALRGGSISDFTTALGNSLGNLLGRITPTMGAFGAIGGTLASGAYAMYDYTKGVKDLELALAGAGRASGVTEGQLQKLAEEHGFKDPNSTTSIGENQQMYSAFAATGKIDPGVYVQLGQAAKNLSVLQKTDLADSTKELATDFSDLGNKADEIAAKVGGIDDSKISRIKEMWNSGNQAGAQAEMVKALADNLKDAANTVGVFSTAWRGFTSLFGDTGKLMSHDVLGGAEGQLDALKQKLDAATNYYNDAVAHRQDNNTLGGNDNGDRWVAETKKQLDALQKDYDAAAAKAAAFKKAQDSFDVGKVVRSQNPDTQAIKTMQASAALIQKYLDEGGTDADGSKRRTMDALMKSAAQMKQDLTEGGAAFADSIRQAQESLRTVGFTGLGTARAQLDLQHNQNNDNIIRSTTGTKQEDALRAEQERYQTALQTLTKSTEYAAGRISGALSTVPQGAQKQIIDIAARNGVTDPNLAAVIYQRSAKDGTFEGAKQGVIEGMKAGKDGASSDAGAGKATSSLTGAIADFAAGIKKIESGSFEGNYQALGKVITRDKGTDNEHQDRAYGAYQVMGDNVPSWTKQATGTSMSVSDYLNDPKAQDTVFAYMFGKFTRQYGSAEDAASVWLSGRPRSGDNTTPDANGTTSSKYASQFTQNVQDYQKQNGSKPLTLDVASSALDDFKKNMESFKDNMDKYGQNVTKALTATLFGDQYVNDAHKQAEAVQILKSANADGSASDLARANALRLANIQTKENAELLANEQKYTNTKDLDAANAATRQKYDAEREGVPLTNSMTEALRGANVEVANFNQSLKMVQFNKDNNFAMSQLGRDSYEQQGYSKARSMFGDDTSSPEAQQVINATRLTATLGDLKSTASSAMSGFVSDLVKGTSAAQSFSNMMSKIADKLIDMAVNSLMSKAFGGLLGNLGGGLFSGGGGVNLSPITAGEAATPGFMVATGGPIQHRAGGGLSNYVDVSKFGSPLITGGHIRGAGTATSDSIPTMLSNGEYVINAASTAKHRALLEAINSGDFAHRATGGEVGASMAAMQDFTETATSKVGRIANNPDQGGTTIHNYNTTVTVPPTTNQDQGDAIAKAINVSFEKRLRKSQIDNRRAKPLFG